MSLKFCGLQAQCNCRMPVFSTNAFPTGMTVTPTSRPPKDDLFPVSMAIGYGPQASGCGAQSTDSLICVIYFQQKFSPRTTATPVNTALSLNFEEISTFMWIILWKSEQLPA
jgi:hypothetical protein